jgi:hypothetical protein
MQRLLEFQEIKRYFFGNWAPHADGDDLTAEGRDGERISQ